MVKMNLKKKKTKTKMEEEEVMKNMVQTRALCIISGKFQMSQLLDGCPQLSVWYTISS